MSKHPKNRKILKHQFSLSWGNSQNLHSCHMEELTIKIDEMMHFIQNNKRTIDTKSFRIFLDDLDKSYAALKSSMMAKEHDL